MSRQRAFTQEELLDATESLLLERGYNGFHLKALSDKLPGARSTLYEYYANKEEIIAACMRRSMEQMMEAFNKIDDAEPKAAMRAMLRLFLEISSFHALMKSVSKVDISVSERAREDIGYVESGHDRMKDRLFGLFERAQQDGTIRSDIPHTIMVSVFFHLIDTPNWLELPLEERFEYLFRLWWTGADGKQTNH